MNRDALGAIGELVGAAAVVLTLVYLAVQIRQASRSSRQQSYHDLVTRRSDCFFKMVESDDFTRILIEGCRAATLTETEAQRFTSWMLNHVSHIQDVYLQRKSGLIEEPVWRAERQFLAVLVGRPGFVAWWHAATQYFLPEFVEEAESLEPIPVVVMDQATGNWVRGTW